MAEFAKFNPVNFSKNITKTISTVQDKIGKVTSVPKTLTDQLNAKTGLNIAAPPLPPINANVKGLVGSVKTLVKNPGGVVKNGIGATTDFANKQLKNVSVNSFGGIFQGGVTGVSNNVTGFAKASFGVASVAVRASLGQIKGTLRLGIRNCLRSAVSSLLSNISRPNIPFGGINPTLPNSVSINGVISSTGIGGALDINAKLNKHLNAQITLIGNLEQKRFALTTTITGRLDTLRDVKTTNFYTAKITSEVNNSINKVCNTLSPRNRKMLSKGGSALNIAADLASDAIVNNLENQVVKAASGFSAKAPTDFFNSVTGFPSSVINKATGKVAFAAEAVDKKISTTASSVVTSVKEKTTQAYNNIKDSLNSNVPKQS